MENDKWKWTTNDTLMTLGLTFMGPTVGLSFIPLAAYHGGKLIARANKRWTKHSEARRAAMIQRKALHDVERERKRIAVLPPPPPTPAPLTVPQKKELARRNREQGLAEAEKETDPLLKDIAIARVERRYRERVYKIDQE